MRLPSVLSRTFLPAAALLLAACMVDIRPPSHRFWREVATSPEGHLVSVATHTDFAWSRLFIFPSTHTPEEISRDLHTIFPPSARPQEDPEAGCIFVFLNDRQIVHSFLLPARVAFATSLLYPRQFTRTTATFETTGKYQGQPPRALIARPNLGPPPNDP